MAEEEFEMLLDEAFGIDSSTQDVLQPACSLPQMPQQYLSSSSLDPSPAASPVHTYSNWVPAGSPCLSDASMQMHASPLHDKSNSAEQQYDPQLLYSPVRQGSPSPDEGLSPVMNVGNLQMPGGSQQQGSMADQYSQHMQQEQLLGSQTGTTPAQQQLDDTFAAHTATATAPPLKQRTGAASSHQHVSLCSLPREVQMRVLCFVSADSLTSLAQTCSQFSSLCNEPVLWRRLFVHRWGKNARHSNAQSWKVRYMERDAAELQAAGAGAQDRDIMQDIFLQAHRAKRHKALGIGALDDLMLVEDDEVAARVLAWRKSRGFATMAGPGGDAQPQRPSDLAPPQPRQGAHGHRAAAGLGAYAAAAAAAASAGRGKVVKRPVSATSGGGGASSSKASAVGALVLLDGGSSQKQGKDPAAASPPGKAGLHQSHVLEAALAAAQDTVSRAASGAAAAAAPAAAVAGAGQGAAASGGSSSSSSQAVKRRRRQPRRWTQIGNVFCDEQTGWVHVCDESCSEKIVEASSGLLVCPISGTCSARLLTCAEEAAEEGDRDPEKEQGEEDFGGERGRLARAFAAGYYCSDERELMRECGVYLPR